MIPRVAKLGSGFHGAGQYYLNDVRKPDDHEQEERPAAGDYVLQDKGAQTANRVGFTATRNLPTTDPKKALRCMSWLAANAHNVRRSAVAAAAKAAGMNYQDYVAQANPYRGRQGSKPVYTLSIAWHPTKNRTPTKADMLQAADEVLKALGLQDRQALIVEHTDTKHPHVHLIVNRVSPINGKYASLGNDWLKLSWWAMHYERRTGFILCYERVFNWQQRHKERTAKAQRRQSDPHAKGRYVRHRDTPRRDHEWFKRHAHLPDDAIRAARKAAQEKEARSFAGKQAAALLKLDNTISATLGRELERLEEQRSAKQAALDASPLRGRGGGIRALFTRIVEALSPRRHRAKRDVAQLIRAEDDMRQRIDDRTAGARAQLGEMWTKLERRHAAERRRDERRIAERARRGRAEDTARRAKAQFAVRGDRDTGKAFSAANTIDGVSADHNKAIERESAEQSRADNVMERITRGFGGRTPGKSETLGKPAAEHSSTSESRRSSPAQSSADAERIAARVEELEREQRQRRKRRRPRGKSRRIT